MKEDHFDTIVVGTGFASSFFLYRYLQRFPHHKVLVLEKGAHIQHSLRLATVRGGSFNIPGHHGPSHYYINRAADKTWNFDISFGGGSNCWTGCTPRLMPDDFQMNTLYGVGQDWPIAYSDLQPYYSQAEQLMMISGPDHTPFPRKHSYPLPPHQLSTFDKVVQTQYDFEWISQPSARPSRSIPGRAPCCSSSVCSLCPVNSKFTIENSLQKIYQHPQVTLRLDASVDHLNLRRALASEVSYRQTESDKLVKATADLFVLGANAIFNPFILLKSGDTHPLTGKGITEQAGSYVWLHLGNISNTGGTSMISANGYMLYPGGHRKDRAACLIESSNAPFIRNEPGKWRHLAQLKFVFEDLPDNKNYVGIDDTGTRPIVHFTDRSSYCRKALDKLPGEVERLFGFLTIDKISYDGYFQKTESHICSSTRMALSSTEGVVDAALMHHHYRNVLVLGSGSFPTISPSNPTLTISALSLMAADKL